MIIRLNECMNKIITNAQSVVTVRSLHVLSILHFRCNTPDYCQPSGKPKVNFFNSNNACFFELVNLAAHYDKYVALQVVLTCSDRELQVKLAQQMGTYLGHR